MAGEIVIPISIWPNHVTNANGVVRPVAMTNNQFVPEAAVLPTGSVVDYCWRANEPIKKVHATPNGKIRVWWFTNNSNTSSTLRIITRAIALVANTTSIDPSSWTTTVNLDDISNGAGVINQIEGNLASSMFVDGYVLEGTFRRDYAGEATDDLNAECYIFAGWIIADGA